MLAFVAAGCGRSGVDDADGAGGTGGTGGGPDCVCGDAVCDPACESSDSCPVDCQCPFGAFCGDGLCQPGCGETFENCFDCGTCHVGSARDEVELGLLMEQARR